MLDLLSRPLSRLAAAPSPRLGRLVFTLGIGLAAAADAGSITGVCPDGSVFVVRNPASIPCTQARRVEPHRVPPMRPENLPRSYLWDVYREKFVKVYPHEYKRALTEMAAAAQKEAGGGFKTFPLAGGILFFGLLLGLALYKRRIR